MALSRPLLRACSVEEPGIRSIRVGGTTSSVGRAHVVAARPIALAIVADMYPGAVAISIPVRASLAIAPSGAVVEPGRGALVPRLAPRVVEAATAAVLDKKIDFPSL